MHYRSCILLGMKAFVVIVFNLILLGALALVSYQVYDLQNQVKTLQSDMETTNGLVSSNNKSVQGVSSQLYSLNSQPSNSSLTQLDLKCSGVSSPNLMALPKSGEQNIQLECQQ